MHSAILQLSEVIKEHFPFPEELERRLSENMFNHPNQEAFIVIVNYISTITQFKGAIKFSTTLDHSSIPYFLKHISSFVNWVNEEYGDIHHINSVPLSVLKNPSGKRFISWLIQVLKFVLKFVAINHDGIPRELFSSPLEESELQAQIEANESQLQLVQREKSELEQLERDKDHELSNLENQISLVVSENTVLLECRREAEEQEREFSDVIKERRMKVIEEMHTTIRCFLSDLNEMKEQTDLLGSLPNPWILRIHECLKKHPLEANDDELSVRNLVTEVTSLLKENLQFHKSVEKTICSLESIATRMRAFVLAPRSEAEGNNITKMMEILPTFPTIPDFELPQLRVVQSYPQSAEVIAFRNELSEELAAIPFQSVRSCDEIVSDILNDVEKETNSVDTEKLSKLEKKRQNILKLPTVRRTEKKFKVPLKRLSVTPQPQRSNHPGSLCIVTEPKAIRRQTIDSPASAKNWLKYRSTINTIPHDRRKSCRRIVLNELTEHQPSNEPGTSKMALNVETSFSVPSFSSSFSDVSMGVSHSVDQNAEIYDTRTLSALDLSFGSIIDDLSLEDSFDNVEMFDLKKIEKKDFLDSIKKKLAKLRCHNSDSSDNDKFLI